MTQEKEILLKDLCARLPYGAIGIYSWKGKKPYNRELTGSLYDELNSSWDSTEDSEFIVYLRPMTSMTEEEKRELEHISEEYFGKALDKQLQESLSSNIQESLSSNINEGEVLEYIASSVIVDWLNAHHFDYRGLIEKELAIDATELNIY